MTTLCFIDTETTGLDDRIHQPYEVCWWRDDQPDPITLQLPHTLEYADAKALEIGGYHDRGFTPYVRPEKTNSARFHLISALQGVTLVGANPSFDSGMLRSFIGTTVWRYRFVDVSDRAAALFGWDLPRSLLDTAQACHDAGYDIPIPDHTAEGDVRATRAVYDALRDIAAHLRREDLPA